MIGERVSLSTDNVPISYRTDYWTRMLGGMVEQDFGHCRLEPFGAGSIDGYIEGIDLSRLKLYQVELSRHRVSAPRACSPSVAPLINVRFQTHGISVFEQEGHEIVIGPGDCLAYDETRPFLIHNDSVTRADVVSVPRHLLSQRGVLPDMWTAQKLSDTRSVNLLHDLIQSILGEKTSWPASTAQGAADALLQLLTLPFAQAMRESPRLRSADVIRCKTKAFIEEELSNPDLSVELIATTLGCTKRYLHAAFEPEQVTISRYIWLQRLQRCREELENSRETDRSITDIAFQWGFSSSPHFSRLFKSCFGVSPSSFRQAAGS